MLKGIKARLCKHSVGLMYKCDVLEISSDVRSKPLGQKRRRGRTKKLPFCLVNSPDRFPNLNTNIPRASYIPSPNTSFNASVTLNDQVSFTQPSSSTPAPATNSLPSLVVSPPRTSSPPALEPSTMESPLPLNPEEVSSRRKRSIEEVFSVELPPAKRISRSKTKQNKVKAGRRKEKERQNTSKTVKIIVCNIRQNILDLKPKIKKNR